MSNYPFKFLDSYTKENKVFFFGRDEEIDQLYEMVFQTNLVFVYGPSGAGKTSLIQCGLASKFEETDWFEMYVRKGNNICESTMETIRQNTITTDDDDDFWDDEDEYTYQTTETTATTYSANQQALVDLYHSNLKPIYLIYDQFEELYTLGEEEEQTDFIQLIQELDEVNIPCTFLFVMREEYLAALYPFEKAVPHLLKKKLRVEHMDLKKVKTVLNGITQSKQSIVSLKGTKVEQDETIELIFDKVREGQRTLLLPYLQIFMDRMYENVTGDTAKKRDVPVGFSFSDAEEMPDIKILLENFLEMQIHSIEDELTEEGYKLDENFVMRVLSPLVTLEGTKEPIYKKDLLNRTEFEQYDNALISKTLNLLETSRILRYRADEEMYEIAHDTLAKEIGNKRSEDEKAYLKAKRVVLGRFADFESTKTYLNGQELSYVMPFKGKLFGELTDNQKKFILKSKSKSRGRLLRTIAISTVFLLVCGLGGFAMLQSKKAIEQSDIAQTERKKAIEQTKIAQEEREKAIIQSDIAQTERKKAIEQTKIAQGERKRAMILAGFANEEREKAVEQTKIAKQQEEAALIARSEAEALRERADTSAREAAIQAIIAQEKEEESVRQKIIAKRFNYTIEKTLKLIIKGNDHCKNGNTELAREAYKKAIEAMKELSNYETNEIYLDIQKRLKNLCN